MLGYDEFDLFTPMQKHKDTKNKELESYQIFGNEYENVEDDIKQKPISTSTKASELSLDNIDKKISFLFPDWEKSNDLFSPDFNTNQRTEKKHPELKVKTSFDDALDYLDLCDPSSAQKIDLEQLDSSKKCDGELQQIPCDINEEQENQIRASTPHSKSLSLRPDVMNKNIFRAIRRECKRLFSSYIKVKKNFIPNLYKFSELLLSNTSVNWQGTTGFKKDEFTKYFGILINYC